MYIQLVVFIAAFLGLALFKDNGTSMQQRSSHKSYVIFIMILFILQSGLRNVAVGGDTYAYYLQFDYVMNSTWSRVLSKSFLENKDPLYPIINKVFSTILPSYRLFLIAIAIFFFNALGRLLYKYLNSNIEVLVSVALYECLYYGFFSITGLRQTIATGILLYAFPLIFDKEGVVKKSLQFWLLLIIATTIHKSAFLFAPVYFLPRLHKNSILFWGAIILFVPMFSAGSFIGQYLEGTEFEQYAHYLEQSDTAGAVVFTLYIVMLALAVFMKLKTINSYSPYYHVFTSTIAIALVLSPLLVLDPNNQRIVQYYSIFGLFALPAVCKAYSNLMNKRMVCFIVFFVLALYTVMRHAQYAFFWQDMVFEGSGQILNDSTL